jgi:hypothetical protein
MTTTTWSHPLDYVARRRWTRVEGAGGGDRHADRSTPIGRLHHDLT